jgi:hypothetical protein
VVELLAVEERTGRLETLGLHPGAVHQPPLAVLALHDMNLAAASLGVLLGGLGRRTFGLERRTELATRHLLAPLGRLRIGLNRDLLRGRTVGALAVLERRHDLVAEVFLAVTVHDVVLVGLRVLDDEELFVGVVDRHVLGVDERDRGAEVGGAVLLAGHLLVGGDVLSGGDRLDLALRRGDAPTTVECVGGVKCTVADGLTDGLGLAVLAT